jgi:hypothetical protein
MTLTKIPPTTLPKIETVRKDPHTSFPVFFSFFAMELSAGRNYLERAVLEPDEKINQRIYGKIYVFCGYPGSGMFLTSSLTHSHPS